MAVQLKIAKPLNISLQSKPLTVTDNFQTPQNGAWDIIYFCNMDNGVQSSEVYRLGKVINITTEGSVLSDELVTDGDFTLTSQLGAFGGQLNNVLGDYWTTQNNWHIRDDGDAQIGNNGDINATSTLSQDTSNPSILPYEGGEYIKTGFTYQVSFDITQTPPFPTVDTALSSDIRIGGYTQPTSEIFNEITPLGTKTVTFTATSDGLSIIVSNVPAVSAPEESWRIDNISVKQVYYANDDYAIITVEPDATAQTPDPGAFIFFGKDNQVGTAGVTGYFATVEMKNDSINYSELFAVSSEITQSSK